MLCKIPYAGLLVLAFLGMLTGTEKMEKLKKQERKKKVSFLKESLAQSVIFNTTILVKWIKLCLNFHFPNALRWVDVFSFDSAESVDSQWVILYMYDPWSLYMNNVGWGGWWSDKQLSRKNVFILTPKHIATSVWWFKFLSFYVGIKYAFLCINIC